MNNSIKLPVAALSVALLLSVFAFGSIVARSGDAGSAGGTTSGGDVPNGPYRGSKFWSEAAAQKVDVAADPTGALRWEKTEYTAANGDVTFVVKNPAPIAHQFAVEGNGLSYQSGNLAGNSTTNLTIKGLPPGEYQIICNYPGHREGGMVTKLTVT